MRCNEIEINLQTNTITYYKDPFKNSSYVYLIKSCIIANFLGGLHSDDTLENKVKYSKNQLLEYLKKITNYKLLSQFKRIDERYISITSQDSSLIIFTKIFDSDFCLDTSIENITILCGLYHGDFSIMKEQLNGDNDLCLNIVYSIKGISDKIYYLDRNEVYDKKPRSINDLKKIAVKYN